MRERTLGETQERHTSGPQTPAQPAPPNRLHAEMPHIPGVGVAAPTPSQRNLQILILAVVLVVAGTVAWLVIRSSRNRALNHAVDDDAAQSAPPPSDAASLKPAAPSGPQGVATLEQLAAPWSSKKFTFIDPDSHEGIPAILIHIPVGAASRSESYWAFSLNAPYQRCELEYVTSISQLASKYDFRASHPMVVAPCDGSVYDPLQVGSIPSGAWVRGQVVQGGGIRPPLAIDIRISGHSLIADKIE